MNDINDGGPTLPRPELHRPDFYSDAVVLRAQHNGLTLRDYFAAKALQGLLAVPDDCHYGDRTDKTLTVEQWQAWCVTGVVEYAYRVADAMLKARGE